MNYNPIPFFNPNTNSFPEGKSGFRASG